jgi:hypothetical protein
METFAVRVWVPDRPGALGQIASRIGAVRGDVVGIDILERVKGRALDEFVVVLESAELVGLLVSEVGQVDGATVEDVRRLDGAREDATSRALAAAARIATVVAHERPEVLCREALELFSARWVRITWVGSGSTLVELEADERAPVYSREQAYEAREVAAVAMPRSGLSLSIGRTGSALHERERRHVDLLCALADALAEL